MATLDVYGILGKAQIDQRYGEFLRVRAFILRVDAFPFNAGS